LRKNWTYEVAICFVEIKVENGLMWFDLFLEAKNMNYGFTFIFLM